MRLQDVDRSRLTFAESEQLDAIANHRLGDLERMRVNKAVGMIRGVPIFVGGGAIAIALLEAFVVGAEQAQLVGALITGMSLAAVGIVAAEAGKRPLMRGARQREIDDFLSRVGYGTRTAHPETTSSDGYGSGPYYWATGNHNPQRFYGYSQQERDVMRATGIDADTYDSNWPN